MKNTTITEFVKFRATETTTTEVLISKVSLQNNFLKMQDGFIDAELVKDIKENEWCIVYHFDDMDKVKSIGEKMPKSNEFGEFIKFIVPESVSVTLHIHLAEW